MANNPSRWEPFRNAITLRQAMGKLFEENLVQAREGFQAPAVGTSLAVDIYERKDALVVKVAVPGVKPEELDITVTGDVLNIKGEIKEEKEIQEEKYHRREFRYGSFCRSVRLPIEVNVDKADAIFKDGILTLTLPRLKEKKRSVPVRIIK
jgi:HSP20 family protein